MKKFLASLLSLTMLCSSAAIVCSADDCVYLDESDPLHKNDLIFVDGDPNNCTNHIVERDYGSECVPISNNELKEICFVRLKDLGECKAINEILRDQDIDMNNLPENIGYCSSYVYEHNGKDATLDILRDPKFCRKILKGFLKHYLKAGATIAGISALPLVTFYIFRSKIQQLSKKAVISIRSFYEKSMKSLKNEDKKVEAKINF